MNKSNIDSDFLRQLTFKTLTKGNWAKFVLLLGNKGACGNCWCMNYRLPKDLYLEGKVDNSNKEAMRNLVYDNKQVGKLAHYMKVNPLRGVLLLQGTFYQT